MASNTRAAAQWRACAPAPRAASSAPRSDEAVVRWRSSAPAPPRCAAACCAVPGCHPPALLLRPGRSAPATCGRICGSRAERDRQPKAARRVRGDEHQMPNCSHSSLMLNLPLLASVTNFNFCSGVGLVFQGIGRLEKCYPCPRSICYLCSLSIPA